MAGGRFAAPGPIYRSACLLLLLATARTCAAGAWADTRVVGPFIFRADFSLTQAANLLEDLGRLRGDLAQSLGIPPAKEVIEVYLFHDRATHVRYLSRYLPNVPYRRALYVRSQGPGRVFAYWSRDFEVDLRHECTHALLHASLAVVPLWLDEGLAQYFEIPAAQRIAGHPQLGSVRWAAAWGAISSIETLERKTNLSEMGRAEYRDAWAWVHFLLHGPPEARQELAAFLSDLATSTPPGLLSNRLQHRLPSLTQTFNAHFRAKAYEVQPAMSSLSGHHN